MPVPPGVADGNLLNVVDTSFLHQKGKKIII